MGVTLATIKDHDIAALKAIHRVLVDLSVW
jgi:hypothetical protein